MQDLHSRHIPPCSIIFLCVFFSDRLILGAPPSWYRLMDISVTNVCMNSWLKIPTLFRANCMCLFSIYVPMLLPTQHSCRWLKHTHKKIAISSAKKYEHILTPRSLRLHLFSLLLCPTNIFKIDESSCFNLKLIISISCFISTCMFSSKKFSIRFKLDQASNVCLKYTRPRKTRACLDD